VALENTTQIRMIAKLSLALGIGGDQIFCFTAREIKNESFHKPELHVFDF